MPKDKEMHMDKMSWGKLLSSKRERPSTVPEEAFRNAFDMDYERVISSSSVRRLQDKAQVFPLQENDFTRTRLTHSLEVSSIGRSVGKRVGYLLKEKGLMTGTQVEMLSSLLAAAGLVHDLGNPPFGHYGENIIRDWFQDYLESHMPDCREEEWVNDFLFFDGNAQTLRILSRLQFMKDRHGMNFSYGTLGALVKYPWGSSTEKAKSKGKIGFFVSEKDLINDIFSETGMAGDSGDIRRHPATYLLEAADDISYLFADLEDTAKKCCLPWDIVKNEILVETDGMSDFYRLRKEIEEARERNKENISHEEKMLNEVMVFRVFCQGVCIRNICDEFITNYDDIMQGAYDSELLEGATTKKMITMLRDICKVYAYGSNEVLSLELIGKKVISALLDRFITAISDEEHYENQKCENGKLYGLISPNFKYVQYLDEKSRYSEDKKLNKHERVQLVIDFISGMTDSYALNLHNMLLGVRLP